MKKGRRPGCWNSHSLCSWGTSQSSFKFLFVLCPHLLHRLHKQRGRGQAGPVFDPPAEGGTPTPPGPSSLTEPWGTGGPLTPHSSVGNAHLHAPSDPPLGPCPSPLAGRERLHPVMQSHFSGTHQAAQPGPQPCDSRWARTWRQPVTVHQSSPLARRLELGQHLCVAIFPSLTQNNCCRPSHHDRVRGKEKGHDCATDIYSLFQKIRT